MEIHEVGPFNTELVSEMKSLAPILLALAICAHRDQKEAGRAKISKEYEGPPPMGIVKKVGRALRSLAIYSSSLISHFVYLFRDTATRSGSSRVSGSYFCPLSYLYQYSLCCIQHN